MAESDLYFSLLRISAAQTLRAAGLTTAKPSVLDAFTDITSRYLILLGQTTRDFAERSNRPTPILEDVRAAMEHLGLVRPVNVFRRKKRKRGLFSDDTNDNLTNPTSSIDNGIATGMGGGVGGDLTPVTYTLDLVNNGNGVGGYYYDESDDEDSKGMDALIEWFKGPMAAEMRRIAGMPEGGGAGGSAGPVGGGNVLGHGGTGDAGAAGTGTDSTGNPTVPPIPPAGTAGIAIAGVPTSGGDGDMTGPGGWLNALKIKPERWKGTAIGPPGEHKPIKIEGGSLEALEAGL